MSHSGWGAGGISRSGGGGLLDPSKRKRKGEGQEGDIKSKRKRTGVEAVACEGNGGVTFRRIICSTLQDLVVWTSVCSCIFLSLSLVCLCLSLCLSVSVSVLLICLFFAPGDSLNIFSQ